MRKLGFSFILLAVCMTAAVSQPPPEPTQLPTPLQISEQYPDGMWADIKDKTPKTVNKWYIKGTTQFVWSQEFRDGKNQLTGFTYPVVCKKLTNPDLSGYVVLFNYESAVSTGPRFFWTFDPDVNYFINNTTMKYNHWFFAGSNVTVEHMDLCLDGFCN